MLFNFFFNFFFCAHIPAQLQCSSRNLLGYMELQNFNYIKENQSSLGDGYTVRCPFGGCNAKIISLASVAPGEMHVRNAPDMVQLNKEGNDNNLFYKIDDVWMFDNIGVSRPSMALREASTGNGEESLSIKVERLLTCSECDRGPIGFAGFEANNSKIVYFLSCGGVLYKK